MASGVRSTSAQDLSVQLPIAADTTLFELDPDFNFGGQRDLPAGTLGPMGERLRSRLLFRVDVVDGLPSGAQIVAARLLTEVTMVPVGRTNSTFALHRILVPWEEGDKRTVDNPGGDDATEGESTWAQRLHPNMPWSEPGGEFGTDYAESVSAVRVISGVGTYNFPFNELGLADLSSMVRQPESNHGWVLVTQSEDGSKTARRFAAKEHRTTPPMLEIEYTLPLVTVPTLEVLRVEDEVVIRFRAIKDQPYLVQSTTDLKDENWQDEEIIERSVGGIAEFRNKLNETGQFFRIVIITIPR